MAKNKNNWTLPLMVFLGFVVIASAMVYLFNPARETAVQDAGESVHQLTRMDIELEADSYDSAEQDDPDDLEWHVFKLTENDLETLKDEGYMDCDSAYNNPIIIDGTDTTPLIAERGMQYIGEGVEYNPSFCKLNFYKAFQTTSIEDEIQDDGLELICSDLGDVDADDGATEECTLRADKYLIFVREITAGEKGDIIPFAVVVDVADSVAKSKLSQTAVDDINDGTTNIRLTYDYLSEALESDEYTVFGSWEDDEGNSGTLDENLDGFCDSSLTTATTIDLTMEIGFRIDEEGYAIIMDNPLADGNSEKAYVTFTPYGENATTGAWVEYGTAGSGLTDTVAYSTAEVSTAQMLFLAEMQGSCDYTLVKDSSDAIDYGNEKLYDCIVGKVAKGKNTEVSWDLFVDEVKVDYDLAATADDEIVGCASGSSGEALFDVDVIGLASTTDHMAQTIQG